MPYQKITQLPRGVRNSLPVKAQEIYRKAYNSALEQYKSSSKRREDEDLETTAHKVAWGAVKQVYERDGNGNWRVNS